METNHQIILLYYREGLSQRKIAKKLHIHRLTVRYRIAEYELFKSSPLSGQDKPSSLLISIYAPVLYTTVRTAQSDA
ncbi:helix-turn-helix domain-containing protein [Arcticibacter eurypsychrophilus]|uniref:helix-turn-helix domain-containing protein n=1 Tax=Arcticibacter eurypsychrophilus TaxID=1434752 RepID=UPI001481037F